MKCLVCNKIFNDKICPVCNFPLVEIPGDYESGLKALQPTIENHRMNFAKRVRISVVVYNYQLDDSVSLLNEECIPMGNADELLSKTAWLNNTFTNIPSRRFIPVTLSVAIDDMPEYRVTAKINNTESDTLQLGINIHDGFIFNAVIRDSSGGLITSENVQIIK